MSRPQVPDQRIRPRLPLRLRIDVRKISASERDALLAGMGFPDLDQEALSLSRPRHGWKRMESRDVSTSGLGLRVSEDLDWDSGATLCLDVHLPGDSRVVKLLADVMWKDERGGEAMAGVRMAALEKEGLVRLSGMLSEAADSGAAAGPLGGS